MATMAPDKSRSLHNFSLPPHLSWGSQRLLRCSKVNSTTGGGGDDHHQRPHRSHDLHHDGSSSSYRSRRDPEEPERKRRSRNSSPDNRLNSSAVAIGRGFGVGRGGEEDDRIEVMREKLMIDLQTEVEKIKNAILAEGGDPRLPPQASDSAAAEPRPWNLRTRRAACREPIANGGGDEPRLRVSPPAVKLPTVRSDCDGETGGVEKREMAKLSVSLSREEIEEDFMALTRRRPARKPKKRPKYVQKQLDTLFPGLWLSEITADMYKVDENPEPAKGQQ